MTFDSPLGYINAYAKFYQNIPNGLRVIDIFHEQAGDKSSQTVQGQNLHKLSGDKINCLIIGHSMKFNFKFQLTFLGSCNQLGGFDFYLTRLSKDVQVCVGMYNKNVRRNCGSRTSHLWQSRQSRSVEAEFQIFGSPGKDEMRKWTYPYLEVLAEQVCKMNEIFRVLAERKCRKRNFRSLAAKAEQKCGSGTSHLWKSRQRWNAEVDLPIFGSPGRTSARRTSSFEVLAKRKYGRRNFRSLEVRAAQKCGSGTLHLRKSRQRWNAEVDLPILGSPGRTSVEDERDLSKSWPSGSLESGTSDLWQPRQSRSAEAELYIFGSPRRDEMRKQTYPYLEV